MLGRRGMTVALFHAILPSLLRPFGPYFHGGAHLLRGLLDPSSLFTDLSSRLAGAGRRHACLWDSMAALTLQPSGSSPVILA